MRLSSVKGGRNTLPTLGAPQMVVTSGGTSVRYLWEKMVSVNGTSIHSCHNGCSETCLKCSNYYIIMFILCGRKLEIADFWLQLVWCC